MMKMMPASRLVSEASLEPPKEVPSIARIRATTPVGGVVADWASITAKAEILAPRGEGNGEGPAYQLFVKIRLGEKPLPGRHSGAGAKRANYDVQLHIGESRGFGFMRSLSSGRALRGPVGMPRNDGST